MIVGRRKLTACVAVATLSLLTLALTPPSAGVAATTHAAHQKRHGHRHHHKTRQRGIYWGAWIGPQWTGSQPPWDMSAVTDFENMAGKGLSLLEFAAPFANCWESPCAFYRFPTQEMETIRDYGAIPFFSWGSQSLPVPPNLEEPAFRLAAIANGAYDSYIREFAEGAREWGHPFFLRFDWEMNGNWFPWAEFANGNQPGDFVAAWRHVHDIFTQVGATNVNWAWCPYANPKRRFGPLARYYPGSEYVDWTCLDGFNWAKNKVNAQPWRNFEEIFAPAYRTITRKLAPSKPMLLAEMGSGGGARAKSAWVREMFTDLRTKFRRIRGLIWFDQVDRGVQWPIETAHSVVNAFSRGVHQHGFKANRFWTIAGPKILPPH